MFRSLRISHVEFRFPVSENLGPSRNGRMEQNFPVIPIFQNYVNLARYSQNFGMKFRKMSVPFAHQPGISRIFGRMESALEIVNALMRDGSVMADSDQVDFLSGSTDSAINFSGSADLHTSIHPPQSLVETSDKLLKCKQQSNRPFVN